MDQTLEKPKTLEQEVSQKEKVIEEQLKEAEAAARLAKEDYQRRLAEYLVVPQLPPLQLEDVPEVPKYVDTYNTLSDLTRAALNTAILVLSVHGVKTGLPEGGLIAYNEMLEAFRRKDLEDFMINAERFRMSLERAKAMNDKKIAEYNHLVQQIQLGDKRAETALTLKWQEYQLALALQENLLATLTKLEQLKISWAKEAREEAQAELKMKKTAAEIQKLALEAERLRQQILEDKAGKDTDKKIKDVKALLDIISKIQNTLQFADISPEERRVLELTLRKTYKSLEQLLGVSEAELRKHMLALPEKRDEKGIINWIKGLFGRKKGEEKIDVR